MGENMNKRIDLSGQQFGSLTVIEYSPRNNQRQRTHWICECGCGRKLIVRSDNLRKGRSTQCSDCRNSAGMASVFIERGDEYGVV